MTLHHTTPARDRLRAYRTLTSDSVLTVVARVVADPRAAETTAGVRVDPDRTMLSPEVTARVLAHVLADVVADLIGPDPTNVTREALTTAADQGHRDALTETAEMLRSRAGRHRTAGAHLLAREVDAIATDLEQRAERSVA